MPVTTLDPKTALMMVDLQNGIVTLPTAHSVVEVVHNASALAEAFRQHGLAVVLVTVAGAPTGRTEQVRRARPTLAGWADLVPELNQQPQDHTVTKLQWGAFTNTDLEE
jgi:nicotinamidase-related amidase